MNREESTTIGGINGWRKHGPSVFWRTVVETIKTGRDIRTILEDNLQIEIITGGRERKRTGKYMGEEDKHRKRRDENSGNGDPAPTDEQYLAGG